MSAHFVSSILLGLGKGCVRCKERNSLGTSFCLSESSHLPSVSSRTAYSQPVHNFFSVFPRCIFIQTTKGAYKTATLTSLHTDTRQFTKLLYGKRWNSPFIVGLHGLMISYHFLI